MHQKEAIRSAWASAGLYKEKDPKLQQFLRLLDDPNQCWHEMAITCRHSFAEYKSKVVLPILASDDLLVRLMMIRTIGDTDDEARLLEAFIVSSDPERHRIELLAIAQRHNSWLNQVLRQKHGLLDDVRAILGAAPVPAETAPA